MSHKMRKASVALAIAAIATLTLPTAAQAAMAYKDGTISCSYGYVSLVKTVTEMDVDGSAPGGYGFYWDWGTWAWQTHYQGGSVSGSWYAETSGNMDTTHTGASCA